MEDSEKERKTYEIAFLVKSEEEIPGVVSFLKQHNAEILAEPRAKNVVLAYEIKKNKEAVFAYCTMKAAGADVKNLEKDFSMGNLTIRSLIITLPKRGLSSGPVEERDSERKARTPRSIAPSYPEVKMSAPRATLSNEALEKKIEEILK